MASLLELQIARDMAILKHRRGSPERLEAQRRVDAAEARFVRSAKTGTTPITVKTARIADADNPRIKAIRAARIEYKSPGFSHPVALPPNRGRR